MADDKMIKNVQSTFSMYGFVITRKISSYVVRQLQSVNPEDQDMWLTRIADKVMSLNLQDPHISLDHIKQAIKECIRPDSNLNESETILTVIDFRDIPKIIYDVGMKKFLLKKVSPDFYSDAINKPHLFRDRLNLLKQRTLRLEPYAPKKFGENNCDKRELVPVEFLLTESKEGLVYVMGILSQLIDGQYFLEDTGGAIKIDLKQAIFTDGLITEGTIVIAHGNYEDGVLSVRNVFLPPIEPSINSRAAFGTENTFGGTNKFSLKCSEKLRNYEESNSSDMMVILSEMWLDKQEVLDKFQVILEGYSDDPPIAFILCGNFLSFPPNITSAQKFKEGFDNLAEIIKNYPAMKKSKFVFVPGPQDLGAPKILPRGSLPIGFLGDFIKNLPNAVFTSNPCRIQYCTKEIVVFREDMIAKLCRNTMKFPDGGNVYEHYAKSMISQSHLAPMSLPVIPIYWKHDHALNLYPTPDLIIVADDSQAYSTKIDDCHVINPGTFPKNNYAFKVYRPGIHEIEDCELPNETEDI